MQDSKQGLLGSWGGFFVCGGNKSSLFGKREISINTETSMINEVTRSKRMCQKAEVRSAVTLNASQWLESIPTCPVF